MKFTVLFRRKGGENVTGAAMPEAGLTEDERSSTGRKVAALLACALLLVLLPAGQAMGQDYQEWLREQQRAFQEFRNEQDEAFMEMLEQEWRSFDSGGWAGLFEADKFQQVPEAPEPDPGDPEMPEAAPPEAERPEAAGEPPQPVQVDMEAIEQGLEEAGEPEPEAPEAAEEVEEAPGEAGAAGLEAAEGQAPLPASLTGEQAEVLEAAEVRFYDTPVHVLYDPQLERVERPERINGSFVREYWQTAATSEYEPMRDYLQAQRDYRGLNDWGYAKLAYRTGLQLHGGDEQLANLFSWFMLTQSGYRIRIGYDERQAYPLVAFEHTVYQARHYDVNGTRYYAVSFDGEHPEAARLRTYDGDHPGAEKKIAMDVPELPGLQPDVVERELAFSYAGSDYQVTVPVDRNQIRFFEYYPQTELPVYVNAPVHTETGRELLEQLGGIIEGRSEREAANLLLRFTQTAFGYKVDPEHFGREKPLFPEETVYYDYSDCEDRVIMYEFLVRQLLDLDVVGLEYPGHLAAAVRFNDEVGGDYVMHRGERYVVADPTFINADIGREMPDFEDSEPEVVRF